MRPVPLTPAPPADAAGRIQWLIDRVTQLCTASQVDSPVDVAAANTDAYQPLDDDLTAIAALAHTDGNIIVGNGTAWVAESDATARASLGLTIGTHVQAWDTLLDSLSALSDPGADRISFWDDSESALGWLTAANGLEISTTSLQMTEAQRTSSIVWVIDGGGAAITTGLKGDIRMPFTATATSVTMLADQSGSIVVDIWKDSYGNYPPTVADTITASAKPTISAATKSQDTTLTGWTTLLSEGDILRFNVDSVSTITRVTILIKVLKA